MCVLAWSSLLHSAARCEHLDLLTLLFFHNAARCEHLGDCFIKLAREVVSESALVLFRANRFDHVHISGGYIMSM